jgi:ribosomal protein S18 acetylase RimI-like enzyme
MEVRRVRPDEWRVLRGVRLQALADAPSAFETRFEDARARPEQWWIDWAAASAAGDRQAMFLAWEGGAPVGIAGTYLEEDGDRWLISMWTDPALRGRGVGRALVNEVVAFARAAGSTELLLEVTHGNDAARALYRACGFEDGSPGLPHPDGEPTHGMRLVL